jgi:hypothetical protein
MHFMKTHDTTFSSNFHHNIRALKNSENMAWYFTGAATLLVGSLRLVTGRGVALTKHSKMAR